MDYANIQNIFLLHSTFSNASKTLLSLLKENNLSFIRPICIDNPVMRRHISTKVGKVPTLSIVYADNRTELIEGKDTFAFIEQLVRDSRANEPPSPPPIEETVTRLPEFDESPVDDSQPVDFNMVSAMPNKYTTSQSTSYEPKSLAENHPSPKDEDLSFKMLDPVRSQDKIQQSLEEPGQKSDDSKLDIQKILDSAKNAQ